MSNKNNNNLASLKAPVFQGAKKDWPEYVMKMLAFIATKNCSKAIRDGLKTRLPIREDTALNVSNALEKAQKEAKLKKPMVMAYVTQSLSGAKMTNAIFTVKSEEGWPTGKACVLFKNLNKKFNPKDNLVRAGYRMRWQILS